MAHLDQVVGGSVRPNDVRFHAMADAAFHRACESDDGFDVRGHEWTAPARICAQHGLVELLACLGAQRQPANMHLVSERVAESSPGNSDVGVSLIMAT